MARVKITSLKMVLLLSIVSLISANSCIDAMNRDYNLLYNLTTQRDFHGAIAALSTIESDARNCVPVVQSKGWMCTYRVNNLVDFFGQISRNWRDWNSIAGVVSRTKTQVDNIRRYCN